MTELPAEFGDLNNLTNLSLDHNKLEALPKEFYKLSELRWLSISHNSLKKIEPDFGDLVMLTFLVSKIMSIIFLLNECLTLMLVIKK